ncbi:2-isopropylmalate synthase [Alcanivorax sp. 1008]|uniref:2-isopropylmalate synthase n=1 Tax=Alcanivorax sp. 1008 TaxID=2816853 RepID=UPI001D916878|nr:2-isopropylmalate synthase [Alcanivorax sp. 1008]MCC1496695.1 2-isopropylmalate synthase [Alcanivorax sp. 1008]
MAFDHRKYRPYAPIAKPARRWPDQVISRTPDWCAVDLRDGNQALVKPMSVAQKKKLFQLLVEVGFKEIEVGFPAASQTDFDFVRALIEENRIPDGVTVQVLTQAREDLIARSFESLKGAKSAVMHVYNSTSTVQRQQVFGLDRDGIKQIAIRGAEWVRHYAQQYPDTDWTFQYSPESFTGTEIDYAVEVIDAVNNVWQPQGGQKVVINLPATVEMSTPNVFADMVETVIDTMQQRQYVRISLHTHNDRGCAVAAAELGVMAGADRIEGTLLGNGERTGNMDLITMAMNLYSQGVDPQLDFSRMKDIVEVVQEVTDIRMHPRHPYAGEFVYAAFSGSHQDAIRKCLARYDEGDIWQVAYLPIDPADVGRRYEEVVRINSQSGKGGVVHVLERDYGITLPRWLQVEFSKIVQGEAESDGGEINGARIHQLFNQHYLSIRDGWKLQGYDLHRSDDVVEARVSVAGSSGMPLRVLVAKGSGAVSALVNSLALELGVAIRVESFDEFSLGDNTASNALACVRMQIDGNMVSAAALADDTTSAALQAVLNAVSGIAEARSTRLAG